MKISNISNFCCLKYLNNPKLHSFCLKWHKMYLNLRMVHNLNLFYKIVASTQMSTSNSNAVGIDDLGITMNFDVLFSGNNGSYQFYLSYCSKNNGSNRLWWFSWWYLTINFFTCPTILPNYAIWLRNALDHYGGWSYSTHVCIVGQNPLIGAKMIIL